MAEDVTGPVSANKDGEEEKEPRYRPLLRWERAGAVAAGIAFGAIGFTSMFFTKNEGGVAIAILLAGVLLLLGIQGTPLTKLGFKDYSMEVARREEEWKEAAHIIEERAQEDPKKALGMAEGYMLADPGARTSPSVARAEAFAYEQQIQRALAPLLADLPADRWESRYQPASDGSHEMDGLISLPDGGRVIIEVKHYRTRTALPGETALRLLSMARRFNARGLLVVTNAGVSPWTHDALGGAGIPVEVVSWNGEEDNGKLLDALRRLLKQAQDNQRSEDGE